MKAMKENPGMVQPRPGGFKVVGNVRRRLADERFSEVIGHAPSYPQVSRENAQTKVNVEEKKKRLDHH